MFMKKIPFVLATAVALCVSVPATAAPVNLNFSFDGVTGTFFGLDDADGTSNASSVFLNGILDTYSFTPFGSSPPAQNSFEFSGGVLQKVDFEQVSNVTGDGATAVLDEFDWLYEVKALLPDDNDAVVFEQSLSGGSLIGPGSVEFEIVSADPDVVPLPAGVLLLLTGVAGLSTLRRRKKA